MSYYKRNLSGERLRTVYGLAPSRVRQYLEEEIRFLCARLRLDAEIVEVDASSTFCVIAKDVKP